MDFRIADTFQASLARLTAQEQKAVKMTAFDLQMNPSSPGLSFHKLDRAKDKNFWSVRVNADIRLIVHRTTSSLLLTYVDHHDKAYAWAERRKLERHPSTGAMQLVVIPERYDPSPVFYSVSKSAEPRSKEPPLSMDEGPSSLSMEEILSNIRRITGKPALFDNLRKLELMAFGVPEEWVDAVRRADEDTLFDVIANLPGEAQEALLKLAVGESPEPPVSISTEVDAFAHPDAQRRFRTLNGVEELRRALDEPWDKWAVFLHPNQASLVERKTSGPTRVSGSAGTGKTIVALHRAARLGRTNPNARVLLTTFSKGLASALRSKLSKLVRDEPEIGARIIVKALPDVGYDMFTGRFGDPKIASPSLISDLISKSASDVPGHKFSHRFLLGEWNDVVDAWQLESWDAYRDVSRLGRKTRISGKQRETLWSIFEAVANGLKERNLITSANVFGRLACDFEAGTESPFDHVVVDEAQDLDVAQTRFLAALAAAKPDGLFLAGDIGQRIFQQPFSWKALGIDVRGRSTTLRINYRTSHQIRLGADRLLPASISDVDGNSESRRGTVSMFDGPPPLMMTYESAEQEQDAVGRWIAERIAEGSQPHEVGIIVRSDHELGRARAAATLAGVKCSKLDDGNEPEEGSVAIGTMHHAKGLEFKCVAVMACDDEIIPSQERLESINDDADLEEVYITERHLLYVACTRARDYLLVTAVHPESEFLQDLFVRAEYDLRMERKSELL